MFRAGGTAGQVVNICSGGKLLLSLDFDAVTYYCQTSEGLADILPIDWIYLKDNDLLVKLQIPRPPHIPPSLTHPTLHNLTGPTKFAGFLNILASIQISLWFISDLWTLDSKHFLFLKPVIFDTLTSDTQIYWTRSFALRRENFCKTTGQSRYNTLKEYK